MNIRNENGYVLITGLIFVLVVTLLTTATMQSTTLDYKISSNAVFKDIAMQNSETARVAAGQNVRSFVVDREGIVMDGLSYDSAYQAITDTKIDYEILTETGTWEVDMNFLREPAGVEPIRAQMMIIKGDNVTGTMSGMQQASGYSGDGRSSARGGLQMFFEIRSRGFGPSEARAVTASDYRVIP